MLLLLAAPLLAAPALLLGVRLLLLEQQVLLPAAAFRPCLAPSHTRAAPVLLLLQATAEGTLVRLLLRALAQLGPGLAAALAWARPLVVLLHSGFRRAWRRWQLLLLPGPRWWGAGRGCRSAHRSPCPEEPGRISACTASPEPGRCNGRRKRCSVCQEASQRVWSAARGCELLPLLPPAGASQSCAPGTHTTKTPQHHPVLTSSGSVRRPSTCSRMPEPREYCTSVCSTVMLAPCTVLFTLSWMSCRCRGDRQEIRSDPWADQAGWGAGERAAGTNLRGGNRLPGVWPAVVAPGQGELTLLLVEAVQVPRMLC